MTFNWSFSRLKDYQTCPTRYLEIKVLRNFQEVEHPTTAYGTRGHTALELRIRDKTPLPSEFSYLEGFAEKLATAPGDVYCEHELACTRDFAPVEFEDETRWVRGIIDVLILRDTEAVAVDFKFGKIKPTAQLKLMALLVFAKYPMVRTVKSRFLWLQFRDTTDGLYHRKDAPALWQEFIDGAGQMEEAHESGMFMPKPSGLCKAHCPVSTCEFYKRGNRRY